MVSKRNFFAITIIMAITFFLFQFVNIAKDRWNDYETNSYAEDRNTLAAARILVTHLYQLPQIIAVILTSIVNLLHSIHTVPL